LNYADSLDELIRDLALAAGHQEHGIDTCAALYVLATIFYKRRVVALGMRA
jgi:hypothetical protein